VRFYVKELREPGCKTRIAMLKTIWRHWHRKAYYTEGLRLIPPAADSSYQQLRRHHPVRQKSDYTVPLYGSSVDNGAPHESDVTKFVNKIGADLDVLSIKTSR
jgi:hypothetical protein